jgi:hypothetical protein
MNKILRVLFYPLCYILGRRRRWCIRCHSIHDHWDISPVGDEDWRCCGCGNSKVQRVMGKWIKKSIDEGRYDDRADK